MKLLITKGNTMSTKDMTIGNPTKLILWFALPLFIGNLFQQFYNLVDTLIVGRTLGVESLAAVGSTGAIAFLVLGFVMGTTSGFSVITAQRFGAKDYEGVRKSFVSIMILCILLTIFLTTASTLTTMPLLEIMNTPQNIIQQAYEYIFVIYLGIGTIIFYNAISNIIRALGDSKTPLVFLILASIMNIILDLIFIIKLKLGVAGAGWATTISQGISAVLCLSYMFYKFPILKLEKKDWYINFKFLWEHFRIGFPMGFQMSILTIGIIALQVVLNSFGSDTVAAFTAAVKVEQTASQAFLAIGVAIATYTAQNFGAGNFNRIRIGASKCLRINIVLTAISGLIIFLGGKYLVNLFISGHHPQITEQAQLYLCIIALFYFGLGTILLYRNVLQGMGNVKIPLISGLIELVMRAAAAFILAHYFGFLGVCFATPCAWVAGAIWLAVGYKKTIKKIIQRNKQLSFLTLNE